MEKQFLSLARQQEFKEELLSLKTVSRKEIAEKIKNARSYGDLSENSEYDEAKNDQAVVEARILELENILKNVEILSDEVTNNDTIMLGSYITILDVEYKEKIKYRIVGSAEADVIKNKISNESPLGKALLGKSKGDFVDVEAPGGTIKYEILSIGVK